MIPTAVFMASTITYDFWVIAFLSYAMATFLAELQEPERPMTMTTLVKIVAAVVIGCGPKAIYFVLFAPLLFMAKTKFQISKTQKQTIS
jgi:predicted membrane protein